MFKQTTKFIAAAALTVLAMAGTAPANAIIMDWETLDLNPNQHNYDSYSYESPPPKPTAYFFYDPAVTPKQMVKAFEAQKRNYRKFRFKAIKAGNHDSELMKWYRGQNQLPAIDIRDGSGHMAASLPKLHELTPEEMHAFMEFFKPQVSNHRYFFASANKLSNDLGVLEPFVGSLAHAVYSDFAWMIRDNGYKYTIILCADREDANLQAWRSVLIEAEKKADLGRKPNVVFLDKTWKVHKKILLRISDASSVLDKPVDFATTRASCFLVDKYGSLLAVLKNEEITPDNIAQLIKQTQQEPVPRSAPPAE